MDPQSDSRGHRYQAPKHKLRNLIFIGIAIMTFVIGCFAWLTIHNTKGVIDKSYAGAGLTKSRDVSEVIKSGRPISVLLYGTDTGELGRTYRGRTDSMMLLLINPKTEQTTLISLPRDAMVSIAGYENTFPQKLNAAYAFGSTAKSIKTVESHRLLCPRQHGRSSNYG